jgi:hypothetical protein
VALPRQPLTADASIETRDFAPDDGVTERIEDLRDQYAAVIVGADDKARAGHPALLLDELRTARLPTIDVTHTTKCL